MWDPQAASAHFKDFAIDFNHPRKAIPEGLKPFDFVTLLGTAEAVPFQNAAAEVGGTSGGPRIFGWL